MSGAFAPSILPELASGRGTIPRRGMVEGQTCAHFSFDPPPHGVRVIEHVSCGDPKGFNARFAKPPVALDVVLRAVTSRVSLAIDFDRQTRVAAEEVENVRTGWMLPTELHAIRPLPQPLPKNDLGKRHLAPQLPSSRRGSWPGFWRDVFQHGPSTVLRTVPLPETSSGRIFPMHPPRAGEDLV